MSDNIEEYDKNERLTKEIGFDGRTQIYHYNRAGFLETYQDGSARETKFVRDPLGQLLEKHSGDNRVLKLLVHEVLLNFDFYSICKRVNSDNDKM